MWSNLTRWNTVRVWLKKENQQVEPKEALAIRAVFNAQDADVLSQQTRQRNTQRILHQSSFR